MNNLFPKGKEVIDFANDMFNQSIGQFTNFDFNKSDFKIDVQDNKAEYVVHADLPGVKQEDISLDYREDTLTMKAKRIEEIKEEDLERNFVRRERSFGALSRALYLPNVEQNNIQASFKKDGTLTITLPKKPELETPTSNISINAID